jgi:hypothetical protein
MKGAIVFLAVFAASLLVTLGSPNLPFGRQVYGMLGVPEIDYPVLGIGATLLVSAIINGVIYGFIAWLAFSLIMKVVGGKKK